MAAAPIPITGRIAYIPAEAEPLSAEIGVIRGDSRIWLFDVGSGAAPLAALQAVSGEKYAVLSHFHPDHTANREQCGLSRLYAGANTCRYLAQPAVPGVTVTQELTIRDGAVLRIFPLPSCHAKGSLGLEVDGEYAFVGDALYCTRKDGRPAYNAGLLLDTIRTLRALHAEKLLVSHRFPLLCERTAVLADLEALYAARDPQSSYIFV